MSGPSRWEVNDPTPSPAQRRSGCLWSVALLGLWGTWWVLRAAFPDASWIKVALSVVVILTVLVSIGLWSNIVATQRDLRRRQRDPADPGGPRT